MKYYIFLVAGCMLFGQIGAQVQDEQAVVQKNAADEKSIRESAELKAFYLRLLVALRERDIQLTPRMFGNFEVYKKVYSKAAAEGALEKNFDYAQRDYSDDCKRAMGQLPRTGRALGILEYDFTNARILNLGEITLVSGVVLVCSYGSGGVAQLTFSPPPVALVSGKWYFVDRFEKTVRFQYLDPETGE